jgi:MFS family permease
VRRLLTICGATILVDTAFYAVIAPLLPRYADELGLSKAEAGILTAAYGVGTLLGALPAGALAARIGARATVVLGLGLLGGASVVFGLAGDVLVLDAARFVQGLGGACTWAGTLAWVAEAAPPGRRGEMIGIVLGAAIGGALLGPVLGAVAEASAPELVFGGVAAVAVGLAVAALATPASRPAPAQPLAEVARALGRRPVLAASWLVALPAAGFSMLGVLGPLRLDDLGAGGTAIGATFLVAAAVEAAVNPVVGRLSDRRGRLLPIRAGGGGGAHRRHRRCDRGPRVLLGAGDGAAVRRGGRPRRQPRARVRRREPRLGARPGGGLGRRRRAREGDERRARHRGRGGGSGRDPRGDRARTRPRGRGRRRGPVGGLRRAREGAARPLLRRRRRRAPSSGAEG